MTNRLTRLAGAVALAFAAAAGTPAFAQFSPEMTAPDAAQRLYAGPILETSEEETAPATPPARIVQISPPSVMLSCTSDNHGFRLLVVVGGPAGDTAAKDGIGDYLASIQNTLDTTLGQFDKKAMDTQDAPLEALQEAINQATLDFNAANQSRYALAFIDYGITHKPDPACPLPIPTPANTATENPAPESTTPEDTAPEIPAPETTREESPSLPTPAPKLQAPAP